MLGSLRFRLPALFLLGVVLSGLVASLIAIRFFQSYEHTRAIAELRSESVGIVQLYAQNIARADVPEQSLEQAIGGDKIFYVPVVRGATLLTGPQTELPLGTVDVAALSKQGTLTLTFHFRGTNYLAVARPIVLGDQLVGAIVVGKPASQLRSRWVTLLERLAIAFGGGVAVAGLLGLYLSRRITRPLLALSAAADEVAGGNYGVDVPKPRGSDEISHLSARFTDMAAKLAESEQLSRNFLMSVSHELRTPLTAIRGHVAALREGVIDDAAMQEASLGVIGEEAIRLERLVGDVLDLAKLDANRFTVLHEEVDMRHLCERAYAAFAEVARRRAMDYRLDLRAHPVIVTDGDRVLQIISNLLSNAFRWAPEGGRVELSLEEENGRVSVVVADTGPGITAEERERIFRPFWSRDGGGTGLGLAIARELAVALGGSVDVRSESGLGSRFELVLPSRRPPES
ncbi:MAG TPA: HAMP domain-containing sensor histidine kinase [Gaiellaceae bacterium]|jgi:Signal transduction histidine kinase|nr:HAMP domain-containing sensor histidine kinase [Gaiellaceae bacterium]